MKKWPSEYVLERICLKDFKIIKQFAPPTWKRAQNFLTLALKWLLPAAVMHIPEYENSVF
jgi:hypothetical protein